MTPQDIMHRLTALGDQMIDLGTAMDYFGGFNAYMAARGAELAGAGQIAKSWAVEIEKTLLEKKA